MQSIVRSSAFLVALFSLTLSIPFVQAQVPCCTDVAIDENNSFRYKMRGQAVTRSDRCEGFVREHPSGQGIRIASFTAHFEDFPHSEHHNLLIQWSSPDSAEVSIGATGISRGSRLYRMDAKRPGTDSVFVWRRNIVSRYGISQEDLGLTATTTLEIDGREETVHLPLRISERPFTDRPNSLSLIVAQDETETPLSITVLPTNRSTSLWTTQSIPASPENVQQSVEVSIPLNMLPGEGIYRIRIAAQHPDRDSPSTELLFYNPYPASPLLIQNTGHNEGQNQDDAHQAKHSIGLPEPE